MRNDFGQVSRVLVCGGRQYRDVNHLRAVLTQMHARCRFEVLIHGGATGADMLADEWARQRGVQPCRCDALWLLHKNSAGYLRNRAMLLLLPQLVIAFPGGRGTANMIELARGVAVPVVTIPGPDSSSVVWGLE